MTKTEARKYINQHAGSKLNIYQISLLKELVNATHTPEKDQPIEQCRATISVASLADRLTISDRSVQRILRQLEEMKLVSIRYTGRQSAYSVNLAQVVDWPSARATRAAKRAQQRDEENFMRRFRRSLQPSKPDDFAELTEYAEIKRG
jgi:Mn-dependent DtxR family transcriptional regulator